MKNTRELYQALLDGKTLKNSNGTHLTLENSTKIYIGDPKQWSIYNEWAMKPAEWYILNDGKIYNYVTPHITKPQKFGMKYHTKEATERARDEMREANLLRYWVSVVDPGWEADWDNENQCKYYIYRTNNKKYKHRYNWIEKGIGTVYMSEEAAQKICKALNSGELVIGGQ